jgi:hypothetical protein
MDVRARSNPRDTIHLGMFFQIESSSRSSAPPAAAEYVVTLFVGQCPLFLLPRPYPVVILMACI